jgi:molybdopterin-binding protein
MNRIKAKIIDIKANQNLHIVKFDSKGTLLTMMSLELPKEVDIGKTVTIGFKPSHLSLAKNFSGSVSFSNKIDTKIIAIDKGELLTIVRLSANCANMESLITLNSATQMDLNIGDEVTAFIKASELSIVEVENGI